MVEDNTGEPSAMGFLSGKYIAQHYSMLLHKLDYCCRLSTVHSHYMILESVCGFELVSTDLAGLHEGGNCLLQLLDKVAVVFVVTEHPPYGRPPGPTPAVLTPGQPPEPPPVGQPPEPPPE